MNRLDTDAPALAAVAAPAPPEAKSPLLVLPLLGCPKPLAPVGAPNPAPSKPAVEDEGAEEAKL